MVGSSWGLATQDRQLLMWRDGMSEEQARDINKRKEGLIQEICSETMRQALNSSNNGYKETETRDSET
jgi:hypothetical protein